MVHVSSIGKGKTNLDMSARERLLKSCYIYTEIWWVRNNRLLKNGVKNFHVMELDFKAKSERVLSLSIMFALNLCQKIWQQKQKDWVWGKSRHVFLHWHKRKWVWKGRRTRLVYGILNHIIISINDLEYNILHTRFLVHLYEHFSY